MENEHTINALIRKRAEIAGKIENLQAQLKQAVIDLDNVESTLRLFAPDIDMETIGPRRVPPAHQAFRGEITRILMDALRTSSRPLTTTELSERVMKERGLDMNDVQLKRTMGRRVGASLNHWKRVRGLVTSMPGPGQVLMWEIKR